MEDIITWQYLVQPLMEISSKWHYCLNAGPCLWQPFARNQDLFHLIDIGFQLYTLSLVLKRLFWRKMGLVYIQIVNCVSKLDLYQSFANINTRSILIASLFYCHLHPWIDITKLVQPHPVITRPSLLCAVNNCSFIGPLWAILYQHPTLLSMHYAWIKVLTVNSLRPSDA